MTVKTNCHPGNCVILSEVEGSLLTGSCLQFPSEIIEIKEISGYSIDIACDGRLLPTDKGKPEGLHYVFIYPRIPVLPAFYYNYESLLNIMKIKIFGQKFTNPTVMIITLVSILFFFFMAGCSPDKPNKPGETAATTPSPVPDPSFKPFSVIYTSNLQGNALPLMMEQVSTHQPVNHFSQTLEIINRLKKGDESLPVLLVDSGNSLTGADDFTQMFNGKPMMDLMKMAGYSAVLLGDDIGIDFKKIKPEPPFMVMKDDQQEVSFVLKEIGGHKVGIYGVMQIPIHYEEGVEHRFKPSKSRTIKDIQPLNPDLSPSPTGQPIESEKSTYRNPVHEMAKKINQHIKNNGADYNILLCRYKDIDMLSQYLQGIDLIFPGNYHDKLKEKDITLINNIPVAPFVDSRFNLGKIDIKGKNYFETRVVSTGGADQAPSPKVMKILQPYLAKFREKYPENYKTVLSTFVAYGIDDMIHNLKSPDESPSANFVTDVMRRATGADIAIINNLAVRKDLRGIISISKLRDILFFDNELVTMDLTGEEIEKILSSNAKKGGTIYRFSGVILGINPEEEKLMILCQGKLIDKKKNYRVVTLDYLVNSEKVKYDVFKNGKNKKFTGLNLNTLVLDTLSMSPYLSCSKNLSRTITDDRLNESELSNRADKVLEDSFHASLKPLLASERNPASTGIDFYYYREFLKASKYLLKSNKPEDKIFLPLCLFRAGKIKESRALFKKLAKKYPDSFPLRKIAASFPDETAISGDVPAGSVLWATFKADFRRTGRSDYSGGKKGELLWKFKTHHTIQSSPAIGHGGVIYCAAGDGFLYAIKPEGAEKWKVKLGKVLLASPTLSKSGVIYVGNDTGTMFAVSHTGKILWEYKAGGWIKSTAAIADDGTIYFGSDDYNLYALTPKGKLKWRTALGNEVFSSPALDSDGNIYVGSSDRNFYCISPSGKVKWKFATKGKIYSSPAIADDGTVYFGSDDSFVYALTPEGSLKWKFKTEGFVPSSPAIGKDGSVFIGSEDNYLHAIAPDGRERWKFKTDYEIFGSPAIDREGNIYFGSDDTHFYALTPGGKLMWKYSTGKYIESSPCIAPDGTIYFGSEDGFVYAVK